MNIPLLSRLQALAGKGTPAVDSKQAQRAEKTIQVIRQELPELLAIAVIQIESGQSLAAYSALPALKPAKAAAHNAEVIKQKRRAIAALKLADERIDDILISLTTQAHLLRVSQDGARLFYLVVDNKDTNLAIARAILQQHSS
ncbi:hypothetical protein [Hymenobacter lapidiphilus]|uniref:hypothetical protein n=1 Tax=Hymenobacter lapidiphilus TaxID=2608003 RepID=UPI001FE88211|nr:hypothetical protein [Hymenobacter lapidiphilus]